MSSDPSRDLIERLAGDLTPVQPLPRLRVLLAATLVGAAVVGAVVLLLYRPKPDLGESFMSDPVYAGVLCGLLLTAIGGSLAALASVVPGRESVQRASAGAGVAGLVVAAGAAALGAIGTGAGHGVGGGDLVCIVRGLGFALVPAGVVVAVAGRGWAGRPAMTAAAALAGAGAVGALLVHLTCPAVDPMHLLATHTPTPVIIWPRSRPRLSLRSCAESPVERPAHLAGAPRPVRVERDPALAGSRGSASHRRGPARGGGTRARDRRGGAAVRPARSPLLERPAARPTDGGARRGDPPAGGHGARAPTRARRRDLVRADAGRDQRARPGAARGLRGGGTRSCGPAVPSRGASCSSACSPRRCGWQATTPTPTCCSWCTGVSCGRWRRAPRSRTSSWWRPAPPPWTRSRRAPAASRAGPRCAPLRRCAAAREPSGGRCR